MTELYLYKRKVDSVFQLVGTKENDVTYSIAWAFYKCPSLLKEFLWEMIRWKGNVDDVVIRLQQHETSAGITDIEVEMPGEFYLIVEAKRGWNLPTLTQLDRYANRKSFKSSRAATKRIIALSECSREHASRNLEACEVARIRIEPLPYRDLAEFAKAADEKGSHAEKRLLKELLTYLGGIITMQQINSNKVYVVALAQGVPNGWGISWIDIVKRKNRYFHPVGGGRGGWPQEPPNYIAFRYDGKLQSIHHIEEYEEFTNPHEKFPEIPKAKWSPHFLYKLGPAFMPSNEVKTGNIYRNGRVWCMLDTLFTCDTISAARDLSQKRERQEV
jgi:hypothetical protein